MQFSECFPVDFTARPVEGMLCFRFQARSGRPHLAIERLQQILRYIMSLYVSEPFVLVSSLERYIIILFRGVV